MVKDLAVAGLTAIVVACSMEPWARLLHGRVWHGVLWSVHESHHAPRSGRFERNDVLSGLHAPIAMILIVAGCQLVPSTLGAAMIGAGAGMTLFGIAYLVVHDGIVHKRLPVGFLANVRYFKRVRAAHLVHHARGGVPYGLFRGSEELRAARRRELASPPADPSAPKPAARDRAGPARRRSAASTPSSSRT